MLKKPKNKTKGFTLIEVIVVVAIIAIMIAFTLPTFVGYIGKTKVTVDK